MVLQQTLSNTDSCIITGDRHSGKLTLALTLLKHTKHVYPVLITPFEKETAGRKMVQTQSLASDISGCHCFDVLYVKSEWRTRKRDLGFSCLIDDLQRVVETAPGDAVILHRMEEFFEVQDRIHIDLFVSAITTAAKESGKKLLITLQHDEAHQLFLEQVERYVDLELLVDKPENDGNTRDVTVLYSAMPVQQSRYSFVREALGRFSIQTPSPLLSTAVATTSGRVLLISDHSRLEGCLTYLLRNTGFTLCSIEPNVTEIVNELMARPELIIFEAQESQAAELMRIARDNQLKVLRISHDPHVRKLDRLQAAQKSYLDLLPRDFFLEDLMLAIERALHVQVYHFSDDQLLEDTSYLTCNDALFERMQTFIDHGLYFTVFSFYTPGIRTHKAAQTLLGRPYDTVYFDDETLTLKFCAANLLAHNTSLVMGKVLAADPKAELLEVQEASELIHGMAVSC